MKDGKNEKRRQHKFHFRGFLLHSLHPPFVYIYKDAGSHRRLEMCDETFCEKETMDK